MPRPKKEYKLFSIRLASDVYDQMEKFCNETGVTKTAVTEKVLKQYFDEYFSREESERKLYK